MPVWKSFLDIRFCNTVNQTMKKRTQERQIPMNYQNTCRNSLSRAALLVLAFVLTSLWPKVTFGQVSTDTCLPPATPSVIDVPISASLTRIFTEIENAEKGGSADNVYAGDFCHTHIWKDCWGTFYSYRWSRDAFNPSLIGDRLTLNLNVHYGLKAWMENPGWDVGGSCGWDEPPRLATTKVESTLRWNENYGLTSTTNIQGIATECHVTILNIDVSGKVADAVNPNLNFAKQKVDSVVSSFNFRPLAAAAWGRIQVPVRLGTTDQWLVIAPLGVSSAPLNGTGSEVSTAIKLSAIIQVVQSSTTPQPGPVISLPNLGAGGPAQGSGIKLYAQGSVSFRDASEKLTTKFAGKKYNTALGQTTVHDVEASGNGKQVTLIMNTAGGLKASIRADGRLVYDPATKSMKVTKLVLSGSSADPQTQQIIDALVKDPAFVSDVQAGAQWPLGPQLLQLKNDLQAALNRPLGPNVTLSGQVNDPVPGDVFALPTSPQVGGARPNGYFRLFVTVDGTAKIMAN
jgi:hypothetical protein